MTVTNKTKFGFCERFYGHGLKERFSRLRLRYPNLVSIKEFRGVGVIYNQGSERGGRRRFFFFFKKEFSKTSRTRV